MSGPAGTSGDEVSDTWDLVVREVAAAQRRVLAKVEHDGLPAPWFEVLRLLLGAPEHRMPMSALARDLSMTAGGFTKLADRMAEEELIDRRGSAGDRRVVYAALTAKGLRQAESSAVLYKAGLKEHVTNVLSRKRLAELAAAAMMLRQANQEPDVSAPGGTDDLLKQRDPALPERRGRGRRSR